MPFSDFVLIVLAVPFVPMDAGIPQVQMGA